MAYLFVFLGAGLGGMLRHGINTWAQYLWGGGFPWSTVFINITGSLLMGLLMELLALKFDLPQHLRLLLTTGVLGGYTTFSTFSLETALLWERGQLWQAALYVAASVGLGIAALLAAMWAVRTALSA